MSGTAPRGTSRASEVFPRNMSCVSGPPLQYVVSVSPPRSLVRTEYLCASWQPSSAVVSFSPGAGKSRVRTLLLARLTSQEKVLLKSDSRPGRSSPEGGVQAVSVQSVDGGGKDDD